MLPKLSIQDVPFPVRLSTLIRRRFQVKPATLLIPIDLYLFLLVEEFYDTRYQSCSFSLINVGIGFSLPALFFLLSFILQACWSNQLFLSTLPTKSTA